ALNLKFSRDVQKTTIRLIHQLAAVLEMPAVGVCIRSEKTSEPIVIFDRSRPLQSNSLSISKFLCIDVQMAIENGGTRESLLRSIRPKRPSTRWDVEPIDLDEIEQTLAASGLIKRL